MCIRDRSVTEKKNNGGFSLVELIVVIAISVVLIGAATISIRSVMGVEDVYKRQDKSRAKHRYTEYIYRMFVTEQLRMFYRCIQCKTKINTEDVYKRQR